MGGRQPGKGAELLLRRLAKLIGRPEPERPDWGSRTPQRRLPAPHPPQSWESRGGKRAGEQDGAREGGESGDSHGRAGPTARAGRSEQAPLCLAREALTP